MKSLVVSILTAAALFGVLSVRSRGQGATDAPRNEPWRVGQCYRVFGAEPNVIQTFKVLEPNQGQWIRVLEQPSMQNVIGSQAPLWLNLAAPFAVQEWPCSR